MSVLNISFAQVLWRRLISREIDFRKKRRSKVLIIARNCTKKKNTWEITLGRSSSSPIFYVLCIFTNGGSALLQLFVSFASLLPFHVFRCSLLPQSFLPRHFFSVRFFRFCFFRVSFRSSFVYSVFRFFRISVLPLFTSSISRNSHPNPRARKLSNVEKYAVPTPQALNPPPNPRV